MPEKFGNVIDERSLLSSPPQSRYALTVVRMPYGVIKNRLWENLVLSLPKTVLL